jgi:hypothetical protein
VLLIVGGEDHAVIKLNREAIISTSEKDLKIVPEQPICSRNPALEEAARSLQMVSRHLLGLEK